MEKKKEKAELLDIIETQKIYLKADKEFVETQRNYIKKLEEKLEKDRLGLRYSIFIYIGLIWWCIFILKEAILWWIEIISWF